MSQPPDPTPELPPAEPVSLDELTAAFAQAMGYPKLAAETAETPEPSAAAAPAEAAPPTPVAVEEPPAPPACPVTPASIVEAMLFVGNRSGEPLTARQAADLMRGVDAAEVEAVVEELNRRYEADARPYHIVAEHGGFRLTLRDEYRALRDRFYGRIREARLSQAAVDTLAIVAYQQPISADEINRLRGKPSQRLLAQLVRRGLLRIAQRDTKTRTPFYATDARFLALFGLSSLADLPQSDEVE